MKMNRMPSYTAGRIDIQYFVALLLTLGMTLGGCSVVNIPTGSNNADTPTVLTGSVSSSSDIAYSDINAEDRGIIAENLNTIDTYLMTEAPVQDLALPWLNSSSGNSGTLSDIDATAFSATGCVSFRTTANTIAGIKLYAGTACRDISQKFAVTGLTVADA